MKTGFLPNSLSRGSRRGMVLLSVLLVSLFLLSASTGFALFVRSSMRRYDREQRLFTARMVCEALLPAAKEMILLHPGGAHSPLDEDFAPRTVSFPDAGVLVNLSILPLDDGIPLNKLFLPDGRTLRSELEGPWEKLWKELGAENLGMPVLDFIDSDREPRLGGEEREDFPNRPLLSLKELLFVPGMTEQILAGRGEGKSLASLGTLWSGGKINVNSAPPAVLALLNGLDERSAAAVAEGRIRKAFTSMEDLTALADFPAAAVPGLVNILSFTSAFFKVSLDVVFADGERVPLEVILDNSSAIPATVRWEEQPDG